MNRPADDHGFTVERQQAERRYRALYYRDNILGGAVMANDKDRAKSYVKAVREGWDPEEVKRQLPFGIAERVD